MALVLGKWANELHLPHNVTSWVQGGILPYLRQSLVRPLRGLLRFFDRRRDFRAAERERDLRPRDFRAGERDRFRRRERDLLSRFIYLDPGKISDARKGKDCASTRGGSTPKASFYRYVKSLGRNLTTFKFARSFCPLAPGTPSRFFLCLLLECC